MDELKVRPEAIRPWLVHPETAFYHCQEKVFGPKSSHIQPLKLLLHITEPGHNWQSLLTGRLISTQMTPTGSAGTQNDAYRNTFHVTPWEHWYLLFPSCYWNDCIASPSDVSLASKKKNFTVTTSRFNICQFSLTKYLLKKYAHRGLNSSIVT